MGSASLCKEHRKDVAEKAGIEQYDEIKSVDGVTVKTPADFSDYIRRNAGREVSLQLVRTGNRRRSAPLPRARGAENQRFEDARFRGENTS